MKASFMILPALLMSASANTRGGGEADREKGTGSAQAPPSVPKRGWFGWAWTRPARKQPGKTE
jgi:hypothetical protein